MAHKRIPPITLRVSDLENAPNAESKSTPNGLQDLLANFALGPAWARGEKTKSKPAKNPASSPSHHQKTGSTSYDGKRGEQRQDFRKNDRGGNRFHGRHDGNRQNRENPRPEFVAPATGVKFSLLPDGDALHLIVKEIHQVARVYSLFDIAQTLLSNRVRCRALFQVDETHDPLIKGKLDHSLFLTRSEAVAHLWKNRALRDALLDEETIEIDPPTGNFVAIAKCGLSGEWLGPPNFHTYQTNLRRMHRERFPNMRFEVYCSKVQIERGEDAVNAWLDSMKKQTRWRIKGSEDDAPWISDAGEAMKTLESSAFDQAFETVRQADVPASIAAVNLSPGLLSHLKLSGAHIRKHPAMMIPNICKALDAEHLPVFKRKGKLFTGPARPLALPADAVLAERPGRMVEWIRANTPAKLEGLWQAVLPEGGTAPPAEYAADLFWMLQQGHVLLFTDDTLVVQEHHESTPPTVKKAKKKKDKSIKPRELRQPNPENIQQTAGPDDISITEESNPEIRPEYKKSKDPASIIDHPPTGATQIQDPGNPDNEPGVEASITPQDEAPRNEQA